MWIPLLKGLDRSSMQLEICAPATFKLFSKVNPKGIWRLVWTKYVMEYNMLWVALTSLKFFIGCFYNGWIFINSQSGELQNRGRVLLTVRTLQSVIVCKRRTDGLKLEVKLQKYLKLFVLSGIGDLELPEVVVLEGHLQLPSLINSLDGVDEPKR